MQNRSLATLYSALYVLAKPCQVDSLEGQCMGPRGKIYNDL
jgi:hypothetical protein